MAPTPWYAGIFLDSPSKVHLLALAPPKHPTLSADHLTLIHMPSLQDLHTLPLGAKEDIHIMSIISTSCVQAVSVHCPDWAFKVIKHAYDGVPHITMSTGAGVKAKAAGDVVWQVKHGYAHGVVESACEPWVRVTGVVGVKMQSGSIITSHQDLAAAISGAKPSKVIDIVAGASDRPPLMIAAFQGRLDVVQSLLCQGADVSARSKKGSDALMAACARGHADIVKALLASGADVSAINGNKKTCLLYAATRGHHEIAAALLRSGANANAQDHKGHTPLHQAAYQGSWHTVKQLLEHRADLTVFSHNGSTVMMSACASGNLSLVILLLSRGADFTAFNYKGFTALQIASHKGHSDIVNALHSAGAEK